MLKFDISKFASSASRIAIVCVSAALISCASQEERVAEFTNSGNALLEDGQTNQAILEFRNALQLNTDHLPALRGLLKAMEKKKDQQQVIAILQRVIELDATDVDARIRVARAALVGGAIDRARDLTEEALALEPENPAALALSAGVLLRVEDMAGSVARAEEAIRIDPSTTDAYQVLAAERVINEDYDGAIDALDRGIDSGSESFALRLIKIEMLRRMDDIGAAVEVYEKLIALSPDDVALKRNYAFFLARNQRLEDAKTVFEDLVNLDPSNDQSVIDLARLLTATDGSEAAERFLSEVTENDPTRYALRRYVAELRASARDIDGALEVLDGIAKSAGDTAEGLDARGRQAELFAATGRREEAETVIAEVLEKDPRQSKAMVVKSLLALEDEEVDDAIGFLRTILRDVPDSVPALSLLGRAHQMAGSDDLANDRYAQAFRASNAAPEIGLNYAQFLVGKQRLDAAEDVLGAVISRSPQNLQAWRAVAQVRLLRSDWVGAQAAAERIRRLGDDEVIVNQISGAALGGMNKLNESLDAFKKAHEAAPASARPLVALIRAYVAADRTPEAVSFLESLLQNNKANALASLLLAQTYGLTDQAEKIEPTLFAARENNPQTVAVHQSMYQYYISRNDTVKADETLDFAEGVLPDNLQVKLLRAGYYEQIENFEGAIAQYEAIYEKQPEAVVVTNNLASLLAEHRDDQESLQRARELAEQFRNSEIPHFRDTLAWAHFRLGEADEAVTIMKGVVDQLPNLAIFRYHLGRGYLEQGSTEAAKTELEEALKLVNGQSGINEQRIRSALEGI